MKRRSAAAPAPHFEQTVLTRPCDCQLYTMTHYTKSEGAVKPAAREKHNIIGFK